MSIPDSLTEKYLRLVSGLSGSELDRVLALKPRDAKAALARQLVKRLYGEDAAVRAEADFDRQFRQRQAPEEMDEFDATNLDLVTTLVDSGLAPSGRGEARRLVSQEGVRVNGVKVGLDHRFEDGQTLSVGKRKFIRIRVR